MDSQVSDQDLRMFYSNERRLFSLLVQAHHLDPTDAIFVIAFWLFLEQNSGKPVIVQRLLGSDNSDWVRFMILEAQAAVAHLRNPRVPPTASLNLTGGLTRGRLTFDELATHRTEIVQYMNDVVATELRRAVSDIFMLPMHADRYLIELVPLKTEAYKVNLIGSGAGSSLFPLARGYPYPSGSQGLRWAQAPFGNVDARNGNVWIRGRSRSPVRQEEHPMSAASGGGLGRWGTARQTQQQQDPAPYMESSVYTGIRRELHTDVAMQAEQSRRQHVRAARNNEWEAGTSVPPQPGAPAVPPLELLPVQQIVQTPMAAVPIMQQPGVGLVHHYQYPVVPADGSWVVVPAGAPPSVYQVPVQPNRAAAVRFAAMGPRHREDHQALAYPPPTNHQQMEVQGADQSAENATASEQGDSLDSMLADGGNGRTLFVTFSRGFPLGAAELQEFLTREYGDIVDCVIPQRTRGVQDPVYTRVVLKSRHLVDLILQGNPKVQMQINGRDAWFRLFTTATKRRKQAKKKRETK